MCATCGERTPLCLSRVRPCPLCFMLRDITALFKQRGRAVLIKSILSQVPSRTSGLTRYVCWPSLASGLRVRRRFFSRARFRGHAKLRLRQRTQRYTDSGFSLHGFRARDLEQAHATCGYRTRTSLRRHRHLYVGKRSSRRRTPRFDR